jgi:hypothetical protein
LPINVYSCSLISLSSFNLLLAVITRLGFHTSWTGQILVYRYTVTDDMMTFSNFCGVAVCKFFFLEHGYPLELHYFSQQVFKWEKHKQ